MQRQAYGYRVTLSCATFATLIEIEVVQLGDDLYMVPKTEGESLFNTIRDQVLDSLDSEALWSGKMGEVVSSVAGSTNFRDYLRGAISILATRRVLLYWRSQRALINNENQYVPIISRFVSNRLFPALDKPLVGRLARMVVAAEAASGKRIPEGIRKEILKREKLSNCYLCGKKLDPSAPEGSEDFYSLEHIWPSSMGGDSIKENLLPGCRSCQEAKRNAFSWEWISIQNVVYPPTCTENTIARIGLPVLIARHYLHIVSAGGNTESLKETFLRLGPMATPVQSTAPKDNPITFFDLNTLGS